MKKKWFSKKKKDAVTLNVIVIGLDNAGKTTLLNKLKPEGVCFFFSNAQAQEQIIQPTQGVDETVIESDSYTINCRDVSGASNYRSIWQQYADNLNGIIFVVDSSDNFRFSTAADELHAFLDLPSIKAKAIPVLVFANKNDMENCAPTSTIEEELCIDQIHNHPVYVTSVSSYSPKEILVAIDWLVERRA